MTTNRYDLVVVGGGLAGLSAGVRAAELGLSVAVLEQGTGEDYACNSRYSGGILHCAFHDPNRPVEELEAVIRTQTAGDADVALTHTIARDGRRLIAWLQEKGVRFMRFNPQEGYRFCMAPPRALRAGIDWQGRGPDVALRLLVDHLTRLGGVLHRGTRATSLLMVDGRCTGVSAETEGRRKDYAAGHVLIADGGFQSDPELFAQHIGADFGKIFQRGARNGFGAGLRMALEAGAKLTRMDRFYGHLLCRDAFTNDNVWPYPEIDAIATAGIVIDGSGQRVADEGRSGVFLTNELAKAKDVTSLYAVFDAAIWEEPGSSARIPANPLLEQAGGTLLRADTLAALAAQMGVPADALEATVAAYNTAHADGTLASLGVPRSSTIKPWPIRGGPFMAIPVSPGITYTMGGLAIDGDARVLGENGESIPGLLAAGSSTGGLEGGRNATYISGLLKAGVFGLVAAETARDETAGGAVEGAHNAATLPAASPAAPAAAKAGSTRFPVLGLVVRYGRAASIALGVLIVGLALWLGWPVFGALAVPLALIAGGIAAIVGMSYVELVRLISEIFMPEDGS